MRGFPSRIAGAMLFALAAITLAAAPLSSVFVDRTPLVVAFSAGVSAVLTSLAFWRLGFTGAPVVFGHAGLFLLLAGVALFRNEAAGLEMFSAAWEGSASGWIDLLRRPIPVDASGPLIMPVAVLAWVSMAVTAELLLRSRRPSLGLIVLAVAIYGYVLLGPGRVMSTTASILTISSLLGFLWLSSKGPLSDGAEKPIGGPDHTPSATANQGLRFNGADLKSVGLALGLGAIAILGGFGISSLIGDGDRWSPRESLTPPIDPRSQISPLARLKAQLIAEEPVALFSAQLVNNPREVSGPFYIRTVALESYDGVLWRSDTSFPVYGSTLETGPASRGRSSMRIVTTADYDSNFLPVVGDPTSIDLSEVGYSASADSLVLSNPARSIDYVISYAETAATDQRILDTRADTSDLGPAFLSFDSRRANDGEDQKSLPIGSLRDALETEIGTPDGELSGRRLLEIRQALTDGYRYSTATPSGHSIAALEQYVGLRTTAAFEFPSKVGYAEQAAALFAVLARAEGFPTRVAVGYRVAVASPSAPITVTTGDAWAWPEVRLEGLGWVPIEATTSNEDGTILPPEAPLIVQPRAETVENTESIQQRDSLPPPLVDGPAGRPWYQFLLPLLLIIPFGPFVAKIIRRRNRHRRSDPASLVMGTWLEARDRLRDLGTPVSAGFTPREIVGMAKRQGLIDESTVADQLAAATDKALYQSNIMEPSEATVAAELEGALRKELAARISLRHRVLARLGVRSLLPLPAVGDTPPPVFKTIADLHLREDWHDVQR